MGRVIMHRPGGIDNFGYMLVDGVFGEERDIFGSCQLDGLVCLLLVVGYSLE